jgi:transposase
LTDNEKTVTVEHVAGIAVRHPMIVAAGRHYGVQVHTCVPFDPESKGGSEATVRIAKADLGADQGEPAVRLQLFRRAGRGVRDILREGQRSGASGDRTDPRRPPARR